MYKDVFISHAKEDMQFAEQVYDYLLEKGYSPWLDKRKIKIGANWDYEIKKALKDSTFVILLLSSISIKKRGYIQKEFKYALEYSESKLVDDIYILPILIDKCDIPEHLNKFHWIERSDENLIDKILNSLNYQREKYLSALSPDLIELNDYTSLSLNLNIDLPKAEDFSCDIPWFKNNSFFDAHFVNTFIQQKALLHINEFRKWYYSDIDFFKSEDYPFYFDISHSISRLDKNYLSLSIVYDSFFGGAHPSTSIDTLNFRLNPDILLNFNDFVEYEEFQTFLNNCLYEFGDDDQKEHLPRYIDYITEENINFCFSEEFLEINFINQTPRVIMGVGSLEIPLNKIKLVQ